MTDALDFADKPAASSERRQHSRQQVRSIAYVELDEGNGGIVLNISEGGLSVQAVVSLMDDQLPRLRIQLPQPEDWVEAGARIAWRGKSRKVVGLEFVNLPEQARNQIREWVSREALPAPAPSDSSAPAPTPEAEKPAAAPILNDAAISLVEPEAVAPDPAEKHGVRDVSPTADVAVVPPVIPAEEPTPAMNLAAGPIPAPAPEQIFPPKPMRIVNAEAKPVASPVGPSVGRTFDQPRFAELTLAGRPPKPVSQAPKRISNHGTLAALIAFLALTSLAVGWAAGRGAFDGLLAKVHAMTSRSSTANRDVNSPATGPTSRVSEPQAVAANNFSSTAPSSVPTPAAAQSLRSKASSSQAPQPPKTVVALQAENLSPTIHRRDSESASGPGGGSPPTISIVPGGAENVLTGAGSTDFRAAAPPPPVERHAAVLKSAELVRRVDPVYPAFAREQRIEGTVNLRVTIGQNGAVHKVELLSGPPLLAGAAIGAVRQWRYSPALLDGKPIPSDNEVSLVFRLSKSSQ